MLMSMADAHGVDMLSRTNAAVAVKRAMVIASTTYSDTKPRVSEVGEALVVAGDWRAYAQRHTMTMVVTVAWQCGLTCACLVALAARGAGVYYSGATCKVDWVMVQRW